MAGKGRSSRGRGARTGPRTRGGGSMSVGGRTSSQSSNPATSTPSVSRSSHPSQYPPANQRSPPNQNPIPEQAANVQHPPQNQNPNHHPMQYQIPQQQPPPIPIPQPQDLPPPMPEHQQPQDPQLQDYQQLLDDLLALRGREHLPILSKERIPGVETIWFNRDKGKLSRVIAGIFRRKFDGPYYIWKVTPQNIQGRYFRTFARKYNWDSGITELVKESFLKIAKKRMKGIVSQAKLSGDRPVWIGPSLWAQMWEHWDTPDAIERSSNASQSRNSERGGLGVHKHVSGEKSYLQVHQEMEEELGRPVSLGEVFVRTHTRADGTFVDQKAKQVAETYDKNMEEILSQREANGPETSENSSQQ